MDFSNMPKIPMTIDQKTNFIFYGWVIVAISFVTLALAYGARYCFSVFYVAILNEFGWPRGTTATILSSHLIVYALAAPLAGDLMDRYGPRKIFPIGGALIGLGLIVCSTATTILEFILYFGIVAGLGVSFLGTTPHSSVLANWFAKNKGLAMGISLSGVGCSFMLGMPAQWSISRFGWRASYIITGLMVILIAIPLTAIFQRSKPEDKGLLPDAEGFLAKGSDSQANREVTLNALVVDKEWAATEWTLGKALRTHRFWALCCFNFFSGLALMTVVTHQVRFAVDVGFSEMVAASAFGLYGVANLVGHALGFVSDRLGRELTCSIGTAGVISATLTLLQVDNAYQLWMLYLYSILFGLGMGLIAITCYTSVADVFYGRHLGSIMGLVVTSLGVGLAIGPWLAGYVYDVTGNYSVAFVIAIIAIVFSCCWLWIAAPRRVRLVAGK
jgi:MFS family permease